MQPSYTKTPLHKRRFIVNAFQYKLMYGNLLYLLATILIFLTVIFAPVIVQVSDTALSAAARDSAGRQLLILYDRIWIALPVIVGLCLVHSILISHRVAGPLQRMRRVMRNVADGDLTNRIRLRPTDYLQDEAQALSEMIQRTEEKADEIHASHRAVNDALVRLTRSVADGSRRETAVLVGELGTQMDVLAERIGRFRTSSHPGLRPDAASELLDQTQRALPTGVAAASAGDMHEA